MKTRTILLPQMMLLGFLLAQFVEARYDVWDKENGVAIRQGHHVFWTGTAMESNDRDQWCIAWADARNGTMDVYAQLYDVEGNELWLPGGIVVANQPYPEEMPMIVDAGDGAWIIGWQDYRLDVEYLGEMAVCAQKIDASGRHLWGERGIFIGPEGGNQREAKFQLAPQMVATSDGGVIVVFENDLDYFAQRVSWEGKLLWNLQGVPVAQNLMQFYLLPDGSDGFFLVTRPEGNQGHQIFVQHFDENGDFCWEGGIQGLGLDNPAGSSTTAKCVSDGDDGVVVTWLHSENGYYQSLCGQYITHRGERLWGDYGVELTSSFQVDYDYRIVATAPGEVITVWREWDQSIHAQRIGLQRQAPRLFWSENGNEGEGLLVLDQEDLCYIQSVYPDRHGGIVLTWSHNILDENPRNRREYTIQRLTQDGEFGWDEAGQVLVPEIGCASQKLLTIGNQVVYAWRETRLPESGIFMQSFDIENGIPLFESREIVSGVHSYTRYPQVVISDASAYIAWSDNRYLSQGTMPYMQRIDLETGEQLWEPNGINLVTGYLLLHPNEWINIYNPVQVVPDGAGGAIAVWDHEALYAQRVNENGELLWDDQGVEVFPGHENEFGAGNRDCRKVFPTADGGVVVVAEMMRYGRNLGNQIRMQKLDHQGNPRIGSAGMLLHPSNDQPNLETEDYVLHDAIQLNDGSLVVIWRRSFSLYAILVDENGQRLWDDYCNLGAINFQSVVVQAGQLEENILIVLSDWFIDRVTVSLITLGLDGNILQEDSPLLLQEGLDYLSIHSLSVGGDGFWISWIRNQSLYAMRYDLEGTPQLDSEMGLFIRSFDRYINETKLVSDEDGGVYIFWETEWPEIDIRYTHLDRYGHLQFPDYANDGAPLVNARFLQSELHLTPDGDGGVLAVWNDWRATTGHQEGDDVYAMRINDSYPTNDVIDKKVRLLPERWALQKAYPNPFNPSTTIAFTMPVNAHVTLTIFDILGREVTRLLDAPMLAGNHSIVWNANKDGRSLASGIYIYQLKGEGISLTETTVLLK